MKPAVVKFVDNLVRVDIDSKAKETVSQVQDEFVPATVNELLKHILEAVRKLSGRKKERIRKTSAPGMSDHDKLPQYFFPNLWACFTILMALAASLSP